MNDKGLGRANVISSYGYGITRDCRRIRNPFRVIIRGKSFGSHATLRDAKIVRDFHYREIFGHDYVE